MRVSKQEYGVRSELPLNGQECMVSAALCIPIAHGLVITNLQVLSERADIAQCRINSELRESIFE